MPEKTKETQKETPLHDVVLKLMFEENKEKPAQLLPKEIFWKITDAAVTEHNIIEVLNWLASHERVEKASGKYSLDRYEFLDQRKIDKGIVTSGTVESSEKNSSKSTKEEVPLHDVILKLMFDASAELPAELTVNDVYWMTSDPSVLEAQVGDVLKWLLHHRRVEYRDGKYSLDRFEFLDQTKAHDAVKEDKPKVKQKKKTPEKSKPSAKAKPKIVIPPAPKEPVVPKKTVKPKAAEAKKKPITPKVKEPIKTQETPKVIEAKKKTPVIKPVEKKIIADAPKRVVPTKVQEPTNDNRKLYTTLLLVAACFFICTCYLLVSANATVASGRSNKVQEEIVSAQSELKKLSKSQTNESIQLETIERKLVLIEEISDKRFEQRDVQNQNIENNMSIIMRLFVSNALILLIFGFLLYHSNRRGREKNS